MCEKLIKATDEKWNDIIERIKEISLGIMNDSNFPLPNGWQCCFDVKGDSDYWTIPNLIVGIFWKKVNIVYIAIIRNDEIWKPLRI